MEDKGIGKRTINYRLRDRCISRQRYWGPPVPIIYCDKCGPQAVPKKDLPVMLPELSEGWEPSGDGRGPLAKLDDFMKCACPTCGGEAEREADVMDNFLDSAWYFFRYLSPHDEHQAFDVERGKKWLPVSMYVGGNEHAVLHLMYTRFITMAIHDMGLIDFDNPFKRFRANGMILKDGKKMSKSKGNVINPEEYGEKVGYDALRAYLLFLGPLSEDRSFSDAGIMGTKRWVDRIYRLANKVDASHEASSTMLQILHKAIKHITADFEEQKFNTVIAKLMELTNNISGEDKISVDTWKAFVTMLAPFLPFLAEELWSMLGETESIFTAPWPIYDEGMAREDTIEFVVSVNGKVRDKMEAPAEISEDEAKDLAMKSEKVQSWLEGKEVVKVIFVQGKMLNIVVR